MKSLIKLAFNKLGYNITRHDEANMKSLLNIASEIDKNFVPRYKYQERLHEIEALYSEFIFPQLITNDQRIQLMSDLEGTWPGEAFYIISCLDKCKDIPGDICEFGVAQGHTSALIANEIRDTNKNLWLFDSFEGLPKPTKKDKLINDFMNLGSMEAYQGKMAYRADCVKSRLRNIDFPESRTKIVPGFIEETIKSPSLPSSVCFAYLDFDFYEPIKIGLDYLNTVLSHNGYMIVDDYDNFSTGVKTAVEEFLSENGKKYEFILPIKAAGSFCLLRKI